jgi:hypothetical protein
MTLHEIILYFLFAPEVFCVLCLPFKDARGWLVRMIEDSDGDPNHTDGLFIVLLFAAFWCFRIGFIAGLQTIFFDKHLLDVSIGFITAGTTLLGVRIAISSRVGKIFSPDQKTDK